MAQSIKSVLLFDYDSLYRSLNECGPGVGDYLGSRAGAWLEAIESGDIIGPNPEGLRRRYQFKRCYADPKLLGKNRGWLTANGVQVIDCSPPPGQPRGSNDVHLALDALDALENQPDELILLSADTDLTPILFRLRAQAKQLVIYSNDGMTATYRSFADAVVEEAALVRLLTRSAETPAEARGEIPRPPRIRPSGGAAAEPLIRKPQLPALRTPPPPRISTRVDREALAALVRRIHQATSVPLFSPKAFADLFRVLVEEVAMNGYKFQSTADSVAHRLNALGRNVTKRQVGFVIKGLQLRGHMFTANDDPQVLAEAFYQQILYLADNAKVTLSDEEKGLVGAWVIGQRQEAEAPVEAEIPPPPPPVTPRRPEAARATPRRDAERPIITPPPPRTQMPRPAATRGEPLRAASRPIRMGEDAERVPTRPLSSVRPAPVREAAATARPAAAPVKDSDLEDSILAAIADAVDVLVK
ncbi:MAG: NYN domain-containing protein, partial [Bauldia sp.]|nr:NYN domain-containing protein [Bauldia sp.]